MAVLRMKKATIVADRTAQTELLRALQTFGQFELTDLTDVDPEIPLADATTEELDAAGKARIQQALQTLGRFQKKSGGLVETFVDVKYLLSLDEYRQLTAGEHLPTVERIEELDSILAAQRDERKRTEVLLQSLAPLRELMLPLERIAPTGHCTVLLGTVPAPEESRLAADLAEIGEAHIERISVTGRDAFVFVVHLTANARAAQALTAHGFVPLSLPTLTGLPLHNIAAGEERIKAIDARIADCEKELRQLSEAETIRFKAIHDGFVAAEHRVSAHERALSTPHLVVLEGWIIEAKAESLASVVRGACPGAEIILADPGDGDNPPIALESNAVVEPFQFVTRIYGAPTYTEMDPTPWLAPFFALFFGTALGDAGYGLLMAVFFFISLRKWFKLTWRGKQMSRLMIMIGLASIVMGIATGSFFGDLPAYLPLPALNALRVKLTLIDPMANPLGMMLVALGMGVLQVYTGVIAKFVSVVRGGSWKDALLDQGFWLLYLGGFVLYAVASFGVLPKSLAQVFNYVGLTGVFGILLFAGRANKNPFARIGIGLYGLYGTVGYIADVLSYSRLLALGLSGTVIAVVVNQLSFMAGGVPIIGPIIIALILAGGHMFNIAMSAFGAFIHCARLQFVEFFTKFYSGGGRYLKPLRWKGTYTLIREYTE